MRAWIYRVVLTTAICVASQIGLDHVALAQTKPAPRAPSAAASGESEAVTKANEWTLGLASGLPAGTFFRFGAEIAVNVNEPGVLRVLTTVTPGATENVKDLLYLKGIDLAITHADVLEHFRNVDKIPNIEQRVHFISELLISEIHVLVRPEINSFKDLEGKKVGFNAPGGGSSVTAPIVFKRMGVKVEPVFIDNDLAYEKMKNGELAALFHTVGKPNNLFTRNKNEFGFKFLPIPFDKFEDLYLPAEFTPEDYPGYVKPGEKVETIGVQALLAVYNWPRGSDRFRRISRFIDYYFDRFENFHQQPYHPKWKTVNLAANVRGWTRYWVAEQKLKQAAAGQAAKTTDTEPQLIRQQAARIAPGDPAEQERIFQEFMAWKKSRGRQ